MSTQAIPLPAASSSQRGALIPPQQPSVNISQQTSGDELWEALLATPESEALILQMEAELEQDILAGNIEEGGFGDND